MAFIYKVLKRIFDLSVATGALLLLGPLMIVIAAQVRQRLGTPVLFTQMRPGLGGRPFEIYKFRSMIDSRDERDELLPDSCRMTRFGRWLRSTSLDELPEFFNVIKNEMSIVGPRPLLMEYLDYYTLRQARRHEVLPGITGWAQINGRNAISWKKKFELDIWYVENRSFALDLKIVGKTIIKTLNRHGITQPGQDTAKKFWASQRHSYD